MARIRTIKPEFWTSEQVMECAPLARLLFIGLWNFCDDAGRMALSPKRIKAQILPSDDVTSSDVLGMLQELSANGLIRIYVLEGKSFWPSPASITSASTSRRSRSRPNRRRPIRRMIQERSA
ncbi:hypothetical protein [Methylobacterium sp. P5_C11]